MEEIPGGILLTSTEYAHHYIPLAAKVPLPHSMTRIFDPSLVGHSLMELKSEAELLFHQYDVTEEQIVTIENITKEQSKSHYWNEYREGRATASRMFQIMRTNLSKPSQSIILQTCYPGSRNGKCDATEYGHYLIFFKKQSTSLLYSSGGELNANRRLFVNWNPICEKMVLIVIFILRVAVFTSQLLTRL